MLQTTGEIKSLIIVNNIDMKGSNMGLAYPNQSWPEIPKIHLTCFEAIRGWPT